MQCSGDGFVGSFSWQRKTLCFSDLSSSHSAGYANYIIKTEAANCLKTHFCVILKTSDHDCRRDSFLVSFFNLLMSRFPEGTMRFAHISKHPACPHETQCTSIKLTLLKEHYL